MHISKTVFIRWPPTCFRHFTCQSSGT